MSIDNVVTINLSLQTTAAAAAGFGVPLILGNSQAIAPALTKEYDIATLLADMVTDGYATTDLEYYAASAIASQTPRPTKVKVGRRATALTQALVLTVPDAVEDKVYTVTINGTAYSVTGDATPTVAEIAGAIEDLITAAAITDLTATDNADGTFDIDAANGAMFRVAVSNVDMDDATADATAATDLNSIVASDDEWYFLINTCQSGASITAVSAWAEPVRKFYLATSGDADVIVTGTSDVFSTVVGTSARYTSLIWSHDPAQFLEGAWIGKMAPTDPGSQNWAYQTLGGVSASVLNTTETGFIISKGGNYYRTIKEVNHMYPGVLAGGAGTYNDVTRGADWWTARTQERIFNLLINEPKVPGTDAGISQIQAEIEAQNQEAVDNNVLASDPAPVVTVPAQAGRSTSDKATRSLTGITSTATLAGAINTVVINATFTL